MKQDNRQKALIIKNLSKSFNDKVAVNNISLELQRGEFYGLLGANGAGKTTTMRMIAGLLEADSGEIEILGINIKENPVEAKKIMAWLPDEPLLYDKLSPIEYLEYVCGLWNVDSNKGAKLAEDLLKRFDLWEVRGKRCEGFSRGMKQKTAIAGALIHEPKLLLMDEPFSGLDVAVARDLKDLLVEKTKEGATIILTTHIMEVAQKLAGRMGIVNSGKLLAEGTLDELRIKFNMQNQSLEDIFLYLVDNHYVDKRLKDVAI